jgi:tetratricopeptide (TPR) repeat protein
MTEAAALARSRHLVALRRWDEALSALQPVLASDSEGHEAWCLRAQCMLALGRYSEAISSAQRALTLNPDAEWPHRLLALAYLNSRQTAKARAEADEAVRLDPTSPHTLHVLAISLLRQRKRQEAQEVAQRSVAENPHNDLAYLTLATVARVRRQWDVAEDAYRQGLRIDPNDHELMLGLAEVLHRRGRQEEAGEAYVAAARIAPTDSRARHGLARLGLPLVAVGFGLKFVGIQVLRGVAVASGSPLHAAIWFAVLLGAGCLITTLLKRRAARNLPASIRAGLSADYRNAALVWLGVWGIACLFLSLWAITITPAKGGGGMKSLLLVAIGVAAIVAALRFRIGVLRRPDVREILERTLPSFFRLRRRLKRRA